MPRQMRGGSIQHTRRLRNRGGTRRRRIPPAPRRRVNPSPTVHRDSRGAIASSNASSAAGSCPLCPRIVSLGLPVLAHSWRNGGLAVRRSVASASRTCHSISAVAPYFVHKIRSLLATKAACGMRPASGLVDVADPGIDLGNRGVEREFDAGRVRGPLVVVTPVACPTDSPPGATPGSRRRPALHYRRRFLPHPVPAAGQRR
jgi:hypothetical protein